VSVEDFVAVRSAATLEIVTTLARASGAMNGLHAPT
jgi:hypothetical protein